MQTRTFFIAYRHTGEDLLELEQRLSKVQMALMTHKIKGYATLSEEEAFVGSKLTPGQIMERAFQKVAAMDGLFVLIMNNEKSEGQLMEVGYALALKKTIVVAYQRDAKTYVHELATHAIVFEDMNDLAKQIAELAL